MGLRDGWQRWVHNPQSALWRKILVKVHLWTGLTLGLYVVVMSVSGSAAVFRRDLALWLMPANQAGHAPLAIALMERCADLHDNLAAGDTGRLVNGYAAIAFTLLVTSKRRRPLVARPLALAAQPDRTRPSRTRRFTWHVHGARVLGICPDGRMGDHRHLFRLPGSVQ